MSKDTEKRINFQKRLAARFDCGKIIDKKERKMCEALKLFRRFNIDINRIGAELQNNLEAINAQEISLVNNFFAGDSPFLITLAILEELSKMTPSSAQSVGIDSMLRPEYEKIEKLSAQVDDRKREMSDMESDFQKRSESYKNNHTTMSRLLDDHKELLSSFSELKTEYRNLRYIYDELEVINNNVISRAQRREDIDQDLAKVDKTVEELLDAEAKIEEIHIKINERSDIIEAELKEIALEDIT